MMCKIPLAEYRGAGQAQGHNVANADCGSLKLWLDIPSACYIMKLRMAEFGLRKCLFWVAKILKPRGRDFEDFRSGSY